MHEHIQQDVELALQEDLGAGDITANLIPKTECISATLITREVGIIAGMAWFIETYKQVDSSVKINWLVEEGDTLSPNQVLCEIEGNARSVLTAERVAINFLQTLSAVATKTHRYVQAIAGSSATILDTRKTIPGLRVALKYAVTCGGGRNHRMGLYDAFLIKENHIQACGSIEAAILAARTQGTGKPIEVEVETLDELQHALEAKADIVMLDNFDLKTMKKAVELNNRRAKLEASGNVSLETVQAIAKTGVDYISVGDLTKNIQALDLSLRVN